MGITTTLTQYQSDEYIESIIIFTLLMGVTLNQSNVQCSIADLNSLSTKVFVNLSGIIIVITLTVARYLITSHYLVPLEPTGLNIVQEYYALLNTTIILDWDPPPGSGPEAIVNNYTVTITPAPVSHPASNVVITPPWNVTLNYNVMYTATITASNCAGNSAVLTLSTIEYSEYIFS